MDNPEEFIIGALLVISGILGFIAATLVAISSQLRGILRELRCRK